MVVLATGSTPSVPPLEGLSGAAYWTSDVALSTGEQPRSLIILGGGAVGCELAQAFALLGTRVHLIEVAGRLLPSEAPLAGNALAARLRQDRVSVHLGQVATRASGNGGQCEVSLPGGTVIAGERILVAGGRDPRTDGLGLEAAGAQRDPETGAVLVTRRCQVRGTNGGAIGGLFAVGDVTGVSNYTHSANYQARIVAAEVSGKGHDADYSAVPRVVYTEPAVFCAGLTADQAAGQGIHGRTARFSVADVERAALLEAALPPGEHADVHGDVELVLDAERDVLVGATCVGHQADSWGAELALAIRAQVPLAVLRDTMRAFPTWSEAVTPALDDLA